MRLTSRQFEVARLAATMLPRREIARRLNVGVRSIDAMLYRIFKRLGIDGRRALAAQLADVEIRDINGGGQKSRHGLTVGDAVTITGGRFVGRRGRYAGAENGSQIRVQIGGATFALRAKYVQREVA